MITQAIRHTWDGQPLPPSDRAVVQAVDTGASVRLYVFAPFHSDPAPPGPPGPTPGLWEHEVVEWFAAGPDGTYLEVELGPHGHHLVLRLSGVRQVVQSGLPMHTTTRRCGGSWWSGTAEIPHAWLPKGTLRANAYRIHGLATGRRYLCATPLPGARPDFHQPDRFAPVQLGNPDPDVNLRTLVGHRIAALYDLDLPAAARIVDGVPPADPGPWTVACLRSLGVVREDGGATSDSMG